MSLLSMILLTTVPELATEGISAQYTFLPSDPMSAFIIGMLVFLICVFGFLILTIMQFKRVLYPSQKPALKGFVAQLTDTVPVDEEESILMDHEYDGIRELDNNLPPWWKYLFYATIVFAGVYLYYYHFTDANKLQIAEYQQEMATAELELQEYRKHAANSIDETNVTLSDAAGVETGKTLFEENCVACHGKVGEGGVGPNLTDAYWIHGGGLNNVFKTIKYGVPEKGMISWKAQLSPLNMQQISSYVLSIGGTNPANAKAPQGDKYEGK